MAYQHAPDQARYEVVSDAEHEHDCTALFAATSSAPGEGEV